MEQRIWNFSIFKWLWINYLKHLSNKACDFNYLPGEIIIKEWDKNNDDIYLISSGEADIYIWRKKIKTIETWDIVWEMASLTNSPRSATVKAKTSVCLIKLNKAWFTKIINETKHWQEIKNIVAKRVHHNASQFGKVKRYK
jgi:CRP-like cAMP-binding protein